MNFIKKEADDFFKEEPKISVPPQIQKPPYTIFCDLNGVLTDFTARFEHYTGMEPEVYKQLHGVGPFWNLINKRIGSSFWEGLDWTPEGKKLWELIKNYNPIILTSPSRNNFSVKGKTDWVDKNLGTPHLTFCAAEKKHEFCKDTYILIDDREDTINKWNKSGGIGLLCKNNNMTPVINDLNQLGYL
jgi:hypothetical protein